MISKVGEGRGEKAQMVSKQEWGKYVHIAPVICRTLHRSGLGASERQMPPPPPS